MARIHQASQTDVARAAGVGQKTVSRAFGAPGYITAAMRARVIAAAERLGYRPNTGARAMRTGRFDTVLLLQSQDHVLSYLPQELLHGIEGDLQQAGIALTAGRFADTHLAADEEFLPRTLRELSADGILINYETNIPGELSAHMQRHAIPAIWINSKQDADCVHPDDQQGGRLLTEHLLALGHRRIAYIDVLLKTTPECHYSRADRLAGYRAGMQAGGLPALPILPERAIPFAHLADWLGKALRDYTAAITYDTNEAGAAILGVERLGRRVPRDFSIASFSLLTNTRCGLPLTCAINPMAEMGRQAARAIRQRIAADDRPLPPLAVPFTLVASSSTAAIP